MYQLAIMSPISRDDLQRIFNNLDKDSRGHVSIHELHRLLDRTGARTTTPEELEKLVGQTSLDAIAFLFFYEAIVKFRGGGGVDDDDQESDLLAAFKVFDADGDGYITGEEVRSVLSRLGLWDKRSGGDCEEMIRVYDENSDGVLDFQEFKNMMSVPPAASPDG